MEHFAGLRDHGSCTSFLDVAAGAVFVAAVVGRGSVAGDGAGGVLRRGLQLVDLLSEGVDGLGRGRDRVLGGLFFVLKGGDGLLDRRLFLLGRGGLDVLFQLGFALSVAGLRGAELRELRILLVELLAQE